MELVPGTSGGREHRRACMGWYLLRYLQARSKACCCISVVWGLARGMWNYLPPDWEPIRSSCWPVFRYHLFTGPVELAYKWTYQL